MTANTINSSSEQTEISRIAVKPPVFWKTKPKLWFIQLEAQFEVSGISQDQTKYNIVISALDEYILEYIEDILNNPPNERKYEIFKSALLTRLTDSEELKIKKLLGDLELGDRRPSELLRQMQNLAGTSIIYNKQ